MASSDREGCTLCTNDGTFTEAVTWCIECEVFLCLYCEKPHKESRISKAHKTMSKKDYHNLPKFMKEVSSQCKDHKKKYELYCSFHACPCCVTCITDKHKNCQDMKPLSDILKQVKSSASVPLFEKDLNNVKENFQEIIKYLKSRLKTCKGQKTKAAEQIRSMRQSVDEFLNKLEEEILDDLETKRSELKSKMKTILHQLKAEANRISQMQNEFSDMTQYATELQMYVGLREIEKTTSEAAKYIKDLKSGDQLDEVDLELTISSELNSILEDVKSFGDININTSPSTLQVKAGRNDQAQYVVPTIATMQQIKPSLLRQLTIPQDMKSMKSLKIYACRILPDGKYLILDSHKAESNLLLFSNAGIFMRQVVKFRGRSYDSCFVRNNTVAVALGIQNQTVLVDVKKNNIFKSIKLSQNCNSVASNGQVLVVSNNDTSTIVNLNDMSHRILGGVVGECVALFKGNIYASIYDDNKVCCYTHTGEALWTFMHDDIMSPQGLTLDKNGFVYVVSSNKRVVVVSPDAKTCKTILSEADGIRNPWALDINRETRIMIVSTQISHDDDDDSDDSDDSDISDDSKTKSYQTAFVYKI
ncbi:uncharacterized protein LOC134722468 [Mytilus trossulus]|uniref:uncharacterized protein LOC134722468 n=1 Tax=Mytilus trossulus TaxID=6551 RepID=UPI0030040F56